MDYIKREDALKWCRPEDWDTPDERWRPESEYGKMIKALPAADVAEEQEITLDDVLKYCKAHRLIVISEELFYRLNHMAKIPNRTEEQ